MYNYEDRSWMYGDRYDAQGREVAEFAAGVDRFLGHALRQTNLLNGGQVRCPCTRCRNSKFQDPRDLMKHLKKHGFIPHYYVWRSHGESSSNFVGTDANFAGPSHEPEQFGDSYRNMLDDAFGGRFENVNDYQPGVELPNEEAKAFFDMLESAKETICDGEITVLEFASQFLANLTLHNMSEAGCDKMLQLFRKSISAEDRIKIPDSVGKMKRLLRGLGLAHRTYDVCVNDCMLFYDEYEADTWTACIHCEEPRYKPQRNTSKRAKKIPRKKLWYFPITPRLQRLYMARSTAEHMTWHTKCDRDSDTMIHPANSVAWKSFDATYPGYAAEARNVRLGLSTDGFNPFANSSVSYSCWPVFVTPYNLPPDMCMRQEYIFMSLLISGPKSPGKNLDVMLRPLIDELQLLWDSGVETYDSYRKENFVMHAHVMWTISDFPAYGMLSGWSTHGRLACPYCLGHTDSFWLQHGRKHCWFDCHRRFLPDGHPWRSDTTGFRAGKNVDGIVPIARRSGKAMKNHVSRLPEVGFGVKEVPVRFFGESHNWVRRSIFWELPYWESNMIRHNLDVMHCEKNFFDNIKNTVMDDRQKTKDNNNSRRDLALHTTREDLFLQEDEGRIYKKRATFCLTIDQKRAVCAWLKEMKFPDGYAANIGSCAQMHTLQITGMKSHDCHVFMQRLLPIAFRDLLPDPVWEALVEVSLFFRALCATELSKSAMERLEDSIVLTMCKLEQIFPPSFFDVMEHLAIHLPWEAYVGGPVQYRWMYPFERRMRELKGSVRNKARVEGSICQRYLTSEATYFAQQYFEAGVETRANRLNRNEVPLNSDFDNELSIFHKKGSAVGAVYGERQFSTTERDAAELYILLNCPEVEHLLRMFDENMCAGQTDRQITRSRSRHFVQWLQQHVMNFPVDHRIADLVQGPKMSVRLLNGYSINGCRFDTARAARAKRTNNSGVYVKASAGGPDEINYYGMLQEILEVDYYGGSSGRQLTVVLFKCDWFDIARGIDVHPSLGVIDINSQMQLASGKSDPFILATQAQQACYIPYPASRRGWFCVCPTRARHIVDTTSLGNGVGDNVQASEIFQEDTAPDFTVFVDFSAYNLRNLGDTEFIPVDEVEEGEDNGDSGTEDDSEDEAAFPEDDSDDPEWRG